MNKSRNISLLAALITSLVFINCDNESLKGTLKIAITDAPVDAKNIKSVNIVFKNLEAGQGGNFRSFKNFEQPVGVNLLSYSGGSSFLLIDQFTNPGGFDQLRMKLNIADRNSSLIINPQSNVEFMDGSTRPIYMKEGLEPELVIDTKFGISSRGITDLTIDLDLRKSILINEKGEFVLDPIARIVNTFESGSIEAEVTSTFEEKVTAFIYKQGTFRGDEQQANEGVTFRNAITSASIENRKLKLGFLEQGIYELIFVKNDEDGTVLDVIGKHSDINVNAREKTQIEIDLEDLNPS